jgi:hypothetical protein
MINNTKDIFEIIQSVITTLAIIVGGIWSYMLFVSRRQKFPRAKIEHHIDYRSVGSTKMILSIDVMITNSSEVLLSLLSWEIKAKQVLPPRGQLVQFLLLESEEKSSTAPEVIVWETIAVRKDEHKKGLFEIEPGEQHQFHLDFLLDADVSTILVESFFKNIEKHGKPVGWSTTTIHDITCPQILETK